MSPGLYLGVSHATPAAIPHKDTNLEFVEMQDLLPEAWLALTDEESFKCCSSSAAGGRKRCPPSLTYLLDYKALHPW